MMYKFHYNFPIRSTRGGNAHTIVVDKRPARKSALDLTTVTVYVGFS
jgi:hypothetical protein